MGDTLGSMKAQVRNWYKGAEDDSILTDAVADAVENLWQSMLLVNLGQILGGPVTNLQIAAGSERGQIVSIADPSVAPTVNTVAGGALAQRSLTFSYTLVTESGSETKESPTTAQVVAANFLAKVLPPAFPGTPTTGSVPIGWNVYGSDTNGRRAKQNEVPLTFGQSWTEPQDTGVIDEPDMPSPPQTNTTADDIFYIRLLEVQNPDQTWTRWQGEDLESLLMKRMSKVNAPSSTFFPYVWDFVNGNTVEIRPAAGQQLNPRYFYVKKPRRPRFDNAQLPFGNVAATEFMRDFALAKVNLANRDFVSHNIWASRAEKSRLSILQGLNTQQRVKQQYITPFMR